MGINTEGEKADNLPVPPGFVSLTALKLERLRNGEKSSTSSNFWNEAAEMDILSDTVDPANFKKYLRRRPWMLQDQVNNIAEEPVSKQLDKTRDTSLPKGVTRGCSSCPNCQNVVTATWSPQGVQLPALEEPPAFYPTIEEFKDAVSYIASIRPEAEKYGICRIIPPCTWRPSSRYKDNNKVWESSRFSTCVQRVDKLKNLYSNKIISQINEGFKFESGPEFTLDSFKKYADDFLGRYCSNSEKDGCAPSQDNIEREYWRIIENPTAEIEVLYVADLETRVLCSGFSSNSPEYARSGWNFKNTPKLQGSLLAFESNKTSPLLLPRLSIGMCFSSLCWKVEEHYLYSLCYMHLGAPSIWYGISRRYYEKFEAFLKKEFPELLGNTELLHRLVTQISPTRLKAEGIPVYRCKQYPGEIIVTFPRAYFSRFDCGFSCSESVNFAPHDWLRDGYDAAEQYSEKCRKTSLSFDKLLLQAAMEAVRAQWELLLLKKNLADSWGDVGGKEGILTKTLKRRVKQESAKRDYLCKSLESKAMENEFDFRTKRECAICYYDLHFSAAFCPCSPNRYSCLNHIKQLCTCPWSEKLYLYRYKISDLNVLVEALEGNSNSIEKWVKENLQLGFSTNFFRDNNKRKSEVAPSNSFATEKKMKKSSLPDDIVLLSDEDD